MKKMKYETIAHRAFRKYLRDKGYSECSKLGNTSTVYDYPTRIERICKREGYKTFDELAEHIVEAIEKYGKGGEEEKYGNESHGSNIKSLELFKDFLILFDSDIEK